jgi:hypothetical protein
VALLTNIATLYTFVFPLRELDRGRNFENVFRMRLSFALHDAPALAPWVQASVVFAAGNPRQTVGAMNDMRHQLAWKPLTTDVPFRSDEDLINGTPYLCLAETFPEREFSKRLRDS